jgi:hypothetical protein
VLSATKLTTGRTITLTGAVTGAVTFDGSANVSITTAFGTGHIKKYVSECYIQQFSGTGPVYIRTGAKLGNGYNRAKITISSRYLT